MNGNWFGNGKIAALLLALSFGCLAMVAVRPALTSDVRFLFMIWNLFLAWLPYIASAAAMMFLHTLRPPSVRRVSVAILGILWLLFLPNSVYLTTDFIHLVAGRHFYVSDGRFGYLLWYDLVLFFLFSWCGVFLSFLSTYQFHRTVASRRGEWTGWGFVAAVSLLCGYGVFLGRIVRLNSWDAILRPSVLIEEVLGNLHWRGALFSMLFSVFIVVTYLFLYHLQERRM